MLVRPIRLLLRPWWIRPTVYTLVAFLGTGGGFTAQRVQQSVSDTTPATVAALTNYVDSAKAYKTYADTIAQAKQLGIDTTADEAALSTILTDLNAGKTDAARTAAEAQTATLAAKVAETQAAQSAAAEEEKKYGLLVLAITNGLNASITAIGDQTITGNADDQGNATLKLPVGTYTVNIHRDGFATASLPAIAIVSLQTTTQNITLSADTPPAATPTPTSKPKATPTPTATPPPSSSTAHSSYRRTSVTTDRGTFTADIMEFDVGPGKIKVITDTASDDDCSDNCPTLSVKGYADRYNGAVAAINGTYFCPADYSSCAGQVNTFFWKIKNPRLNKTINHDNGLGENDPFLTFDENGTATWCSHWGDCRNPYAGINHKPAVVINGQYSVDENTLDDKQRTAKISRAALGLTGQHLSVVVIQSATIMDLGSVMAQLGVTYALNIDAGGSSGMWYNGSYKRGPGRSVPNALVFVEQ